MNTETTDMEGDDLICLTTLLDDAIHLAGLATVLSDNSIEAIGGECVNQYLALSFSYKCLAKMATALADGLSEHCP